MKKSSGREPKSVFFNVRLEPSMHKQLEEMAHRNERTLAGEIRSALRKHLDVVEEAA